MPHIDQIAVYLFIVTVASFLLDLAIGDPRHLPHPVRWIGALISLLDKKLRPLGKGRPVSERTLGALMATLVVTVVAAAAALTLWAAHLADFYLFMGLSVYMGWAALSVRSLGAEAGKVVAAFSADLSEGGGIEVARERLSMIVGRDTDRLDEEGVIKAVVETVSENTSDGVVAPLFYLALGGPLLAMVYKAVNTLDSMVGYKNETYFHFGGFSARLDDMANYLPARITALVMVVASMALGFDWRGARSAIRRYGRAHPSPNAGLPQAAVAGALHLRLGGPATYGGVTMVKAYIGDGPVGDKSGGDGDVGDKPGGDVPGNEMGVAPAASAGAAVSAADSAIKVMWTAAFLTLFTALLIQLAVFAAFSWKPPVLPHLY